MDMVSCTRRSIHRNEATCDKHQYPVSTTRVKHSWFSVMHAQKGLVQPYYSKERPWHMQARSSLRQSRGYTQIEKEMFAIVLSLEIFYQYIYDRRTVIHTDYKPIEAMVKINPLVKAPKPLQGMLLRTSNWVWTSEYDQLSCDPWRKACADPQSNSLVRSMWPVEENHITEVVVW